MAAQRGAASGVPSELTTARESRGTILDTSSYNHLVYFVYMVRCADGTLYTGKPWTRAKKEALIASDFELLKRL